MDLAVRGSEFELATELPDRLCFPPRFRVDSTDLTGDPPSYGLSVSLVHRHALRGRVLDAVTGAGIAGAVIEVDSFAWRIVRADAGGGYEVELPEPRGSILVRAPGYQERLWGFPEPGADGKLIALGSQAFNQDKKGTAFVVEAAPNKPVKSFEVIQNYQIRAAISPDGKALATWGMYQPRGGIENNPEQGRTVQLWDVATAKDLRRLVVDRQSIRGAVFSADGKTLTVRIAGAGGSTTVAPGTFFAQVTPEQANLSQPWAGSLELYITPWGFLRGAAENNATATRRRVDGKNYTVLTWSPTVKAPSGRNYVINGYVNDRTIIERVETWLGENIMSDMHVLVTYAGWKDFGGVMAPWLFGVLIGTGTGGIATFEENMRTFLEKGPGRVSPFFVPMFMANVASAIVSMRYGFQGPNYGTVSACASSGHALGDAFDLIRENKADVMVAGGSEAAITPLALASFANMKALSERNDDPKTASRPFDKDRDGFVMGDGAAVVILEEWQRATARGAKIFAEQVGYGATADAYHITAPAPDRLEDVPHEAPQFVARGHAAPGSTWMANRSLWAARERFWEPGRLTHAVGMPARCRSKATFSAPW